MYIYFLSLLAIVGVIILILLGSIVHANRIPNMIESFETNHHHTCELKPIIQEDGSVEVPMSSSMSLKFSSQEEWESYQKDHIITTPATPTTTTPTATVSTASHKTESTRDKNTINTTKTEEVGRYKYIPDSLWSVPQYRPPVCIPQEEGTREPSPVVVQSSFSSLSDFTGLGSILPRFQYQEDYHYSIADLKKKSDSMKDYYYPGYFTKPTPSMDDLI